jgi:hypothetical protein
MRGHLSRRGVSRHPARIQVIGVTLAETWTAATGTGCTGKRILS